jgi:hypothetical protein
MNHQNFTVFNPTTYTVSGTTATCPLCGFEPPRD